MATKRRKVWVEFDEYGTGDDPVVHFGRVPRAVPMVERLPGDVVLSREEQYDVAQAVAVKLKWLLSLEEEASDVVTAVLYELKSRGRR